MAEEIVDWAPSDACDNEMRMAHVARQVASVKYLVAGMTADVVAREEEELTV